ncbi:MAG: ribonuclease III [Cyanobacteria bacterium HKST-UBA05]|nr:ribonuclease III [Cyanobacteria bacterium HKST-UBA05]
MSAKPYRDRRHQRSAQSSITSETVYDDPYWFGVRQFLDELGVSYDSYTFPLYAQALTHSSFTYEFKPKDWDNYERLEFLGDAVLKLVVSEYLFERFPHYREGDMTKIRAVIVSDAVLSKFALQLGIEQAMVLGPSEARSGGAHKVSNLACAFEAFLAALHLQGQTTFIVDMLCDLIADEVTKIDLSKTKSNFKAALQELTQAQGLGLPEYDTLREEGPPHNRTFIVQVLVDGEVIGEGNGKTKKEAQQQAAKLALKCLNVPVDDDEEEEAAMDIDGGVSDEPYDDRPF